MLFTVHRLLFQFQEVVFNKKEIPYTLSKLIFFFVYLFSDFSTLNLYYLVTSKQFTSSEFIKAIKVIVTSHFPSLAQCASTGFSVSIAQNVGFWLCCERKPRCRVCV